MNATEYEDLPEEEAMLEVEGEDTDIEVHQETPHKGTIIHHEQGAVDRGISTKHD